MVGVASSSWNTLVTFTSKGPDEQSGTTTVSNLTASVQSMVLLTLGIAPGFQVMTEDLDAYVTNKTISRYDVTGKQLIVCLTSLSASQSMVLKYRLQATMPVKAADGGAETHPYYEPSQSSSAASTTLEVQGS